MNDTARWWRDEQRTKNSKVVWSEDMEWLLLDFESYVARATKEIVELHKQITWFRTVIAEELGYDAPAGDAVNPLREYLRKIEQTARLRALIERLAADHRLFEHTLKPFPKKPQPCETCGAVAAAGWIWRK